MGSTIAQRTPSDVPHHLWNTYRHTVAVQIAAASSTLLFYPLDSVKFRIMSQDGTSKHSYHHHRGDFSGVSQALRQTYKVEGLMALYRGALISVSGSVLSWGIYMFAYKYLLHLGSTGSMSNSIYFDYTASLSASVFCAICTNPLWLVKTRMQLQDRTVKNQTYYRGFFHGTREVIKSEGIIALYRGLLSQILLSVPTAAYFPMYEAFKAYARSMKQIEDTQHLNFFELLLCTLATKVIMGCSFESTYGDKDKDTGSS